VKIVLTSPGGPACLVHVHVEGDREDTHEAITGFELTIDPDDLLDLPKLKTSHRDRDPRTWEVGVFRLEMEVRPCD
jgi:hypothetical protein